ncbi:UNVERIFIED_CONTAM: Auxilin-related protein 2 [Sesamum calycinum]|uniref:Auxilin-related protein 2 n=1 Tax=Sesamum calycinum TaxID=2727403 RepID=A0AAW2S9Z5_9LAMI
MPESNRGSVPVGGPKHRKVRDDPFVVLESSPTQGSSSGVFTDPLEGISKLGKSRSARVEPSSGGGRGFDDLDPLNSFGTPARSFSPGGDKRGKEASPSRSSTPQSANSREQKGNSAFRYSESNTEKEIPVDNFQEPPLFDMQNASTGFQKSFGQTASSPQYYGTGSQVDKSPTSEGQGQQYDDIWLTVSEGDEFSSRSNHSQHSQGPKPTRPAPKGPPVSQFDELEDFAMGRSANTVDESANLLSREETNPFSTAAASAAMKEAMEKAEAKFRHAKEVREREYAKAARNKESVQLERHEEDWQEREFTGTEARLERERKQKEEEERERRRLERERRRLDRLWKGLIERHVKEQQLRHEKEQLLKLA